MGVLGGRGAEVRDGGARDARGEGHGRGGWGPREEGGGRCEDDEGAHFVDLVFAWGSESDHLILGVVLFVLCV